MRWEYKIIQVDNSLISSHIDKLEKILNKNGSEGWELSEVVNKKSIGKGWLPQVDTDLIIFKRGIAE
ncbi:MAG: DUF4177 domain-containing protein [Clostridiaceae bacterium]